VEARGVPAVFGGGRLSYGYRIADRRDEGGVTGWVVLCG